MSDYSASPDRDLAAIKRRRTRRRRLLDLDALVVSGLEVLFSIIWVGALITTVWMLTVLSRYWWVGAMPDWLFAFGIIVLSRVIIALGADIVDRRFRL